MGIITDNFYKTNFSAYLKFNSFSYKPKKRIAIDIAKVARKRNLLTFYYSFVNANKSLDYYYYISCFPLLYDNLLLKLNWDINYVI